MKPAHVLIAATVVAAIGLGGCASGGNHPAATSVETSPAPSVGLPPSPPVPDGPPLPPPEALTDVLARLSDPAVPGAEKVGLIDKPSGADAAALDRYAAALRDGRAAPLTFETRDMAWSGSEPEHVVATMVIRTANPGYGEFTFPMEFARVGESWQLTRGSVDQLLQLQPDPPPAPAEPPR